MIIAGFPKLFSFEILAQTGPPPTKGKGPPPPVSSGVCTKKSCPPDQKK
jgi:hypothetical protein